MKRIFYIGAILGIVWIFFIIFVANSHAAEAPRSLPWTLQSSGTTTLHFPSDTGASLSGGGWISICYSATNDGAICEPGGVGNFHNGQWGAPANITLCQALISQLGATSPNCEDFTFNLDNTFLTSGQNNSYISVSTISGGYEGGTPFVAYGMYRTSAGNWTGGESNYSSTGMTSFFNYSPSDNAVLNSTTNIASVNYYVGDLDYCGSVDEVAIEYRFNVLSTSTITFTTTPDDVVFCGNGSYSDSETLTPGTVVTWRPVMRNSSSTVVFSGDWNTYCVEYCSVEPFLTFDDVFVPAFATETATSSAAWAGFLTGIPSIFARKHPFAWMIEFVTIVEENLNGTNQENLDITLDYGEILGSTSTAGQYLAVTPLDISFSSSTIISGLGETMVSAIRSLAAGIITFGFFWYWYRRAITFWNRSQLS